MHDRPLILQHTLQDFIFMKPKARYEVLSAMLGLEPLPSRCATQPKEQGPTTARRFPQRRRMLKAACPC